MASRTLSRAFRQYKTYYLLLLPAVVAVFIFSYVPMYGIVIAFKDYKIMKGIGGSEWVGFAHFQSLFEIKSFYEVLANTLIISLYRLIFGFPAPIILALLLNELRNGLFKKIVQTVSYLPHFLSWIVLAGIVTSVLSVDVGIVNHILKWFGMQPVNFIVMPEYFRTILVTSGIWQNIGWGSIIYLAVIVGINPDLYEAADLDGANRLHKALYVTIPSLIPVATIMFILNIGGILHAGFDQIFNLYSVSVYEVADVIDTYVYRRGLINSDFSFATAVGMFQNVIGFVLIFGANWIVKKFNNENGIW
ncbi:ABC transporter permease [Paenibacillus contaminans]|uniref:Sugar ABC transporter permease n=1 Tax=Paenibacillus contaminans TaxID=450362 RepID=A0A329MID6_9BACL|nr:ABC transporter permease subunit [Paenibacillus contaminans]RAV19589.1 sugar ABC transporter permease [Paenibacillus contaminans]